MSDLAATIERARLVREDCREDAAALDTTPFTGAALGPVFGNMLAQIAAIAKVL